MRTKSAFTLVEIMIVVAIIGLLAAIAIPNFIRARESAQLSSIANNLRLLEGAKEQWALENKKATTDEVDLTDLMPYMKGNVVQTIIGERYKCARVVDLIVAEYNGKLAGREGPFTITSF